MKINLIGCVCVCAAQAEASGLANNLAYSIQNNIYKKKGPYTL